MYHRRYQKIILTLALAVSMVFTPAAGSYAYFAGTNTADEQQISDQQLTETNGGEDATSGTEKTGEGDNSSSVSGEAGSDAQKGSGEENGVPDQTAKEPEKVNGDAVSDTAKSGNAEDPASVPEPAATAADEQKNAEGDGNAENEEPAKPVNFDLNQAVTKAVIDATRDSDGKYVIRAGTKYSIDVSFRETMSKQFPNGSEDTMTYTLPEGLTAADGDTGKFSVRVNDGGSYFTVKDNTYEVDDNKIIVRFNTSDDNFARMAAAANLTFSISFEGEFDGKNTEIIFEDDVVIDLDVDTSSSLEVKKTKADDIDNNRINYTIELKSTGVNTNIVIADTIRVVDKDGKDIIYVAPDGHIEPLDIASVSMWGGNITYESNIREAQDLYDTITMQGTSGSNFEFDIPEMLDGEVLKINYHADIDADEIPVDAEGKIYANAQNSIKVTSNEATEEVTDKTESIIDYTPGISKTVKQTKAQDAEDPGILTWTITANDKPKVSMKGQTIRDTIAAASKKFLTYTGDGIKIEVTDENKNLIATRNIPWDSRELKTTEEDGKIVSWEYKIPETDIGKYKYVITYDTKVNTKGEHVKVTVSNKVDIDGKISATGKIGIGVPDGEMAIKKRVLSVDLDNKTITWGVDITVPKGGLETAYVIDRNPHTGTIYEPVIYNSEDDIEVTGLYENDGEHYVVAQGEKQTTITFYKSAGTGSPGLLAMPSDATDESRTVSITLKTQIKDDWLDKFSVTSHGNTISLNGKTSASDSIVVERPGITKKGKDEPAGYRTVDGKEVPVYRYELILSHVTKDINEITDTFDPNLRPCTAAEVNTWLKAQDAWQVYGGGTGGQNKKGAAAVSYDVRSGDTNDVMTITTSADSMPHDAESADSPKHFYARYKLVYYLTVKDEAIDSVLNNAIANKESGGTTFHNKAEWEGKTSEIDVKYDYPGLTKELLTSDEELKKQDEDVYAEFRLTANPSRRKLNNGKPIPLIDAAENLIIVPGSIKVKINGVDDVNGIVTYAPNGNSMVYTIPDESKVEITYRAKVEYRSIGEQGDVVKVEFDNVADLLGYKDDVKKVASRQNTGAGVASVPQIDVLKYEAGNLHKTLEGAEFALLNSEEAPVTDKYGKEVTYTTDKEGKFTVRGDMEVLGWVLEENEYYYLREIKAPEGHMLTNKLYRFRVSDDGTSDQTIDIYSSGGDMTVANYPETAIDVEKVWTDGNKLHSADNITVKLQQKINTEEGAVWSDTIRMYNAEKDEWFDDRDGITAVLDQDNDWKYTFDKLPAAVPTGDDFTGPDTSVDYRVVETLINGKESEPVIGDSRFKETRYATGDPDAGSDSMEKITVTNVYVPDTEVTLEAKKLFEHGLIDKEGMFVFALFEVTGTDWQGQEQTRQIDAAVTTETGSSESAVKFAPVKYTLDDLKKDDGGYVASRTFTYLIREIMSPKSDKNGFDSSTNIQYDTKIRRVNVTLKLAGDKLETRVQYEDGDIPVFTNTKNPPPEVETGDRSGIMRYSALLILSLIALAVMVGIRRKHVRH